MPRTLLVALACFVCSAPVARAAADLSGIRVAVVPDARTMPKRARVSIDRQISSALGKRVEVIGARRAMQAVKSQGVGTLATPDGAVALGAGLDATAVLLLSSIQGERRGHAQLVATLVDVSSGNSQEIGRFEMKRGRLSSKGGRRLVQQVTQRLGSLAGGGDSEPAASASAVADASSTPASGAGPSPWDDVGSASGGGSAAPLWAATADEEAPAASVSERVEVAPAPRRGDGETVRMRVGGIAFQRSGEVRAGSASAQQFETDGWLPGATARVELFPMGGSSTRISGFGLVADGYVARMVNLVATESGYENTTLVYSASAGALYRAHLWNSSSAPVVGGGLGYSMYSFPVQSDLFPALGYSGPRGTLELAIPIGAHAALGVGGTYTLPIGLHGDAASLGTSDIGASRAYGADASLRLSFSSIEVTVFAGMEHYALTFDAGSAAASASGSSAVVVSDQTLRGGLTLGLAL